MEYEPSGDLGRPHPKLPRHTGIVASGYISKNAKGETLPLLLRGVPVTWRGIIDDYFRIACQSDPPVWSSAVAVKRTALDSIGGFPVDIGQGEDLLTWARLPCAIRSPTAPTHRDFLARTRGLASPHSIAGTSRSRRRCALDELLAKAPAPIQSSLGPIHRLVAQNARHDVSAPWAGDTKLATNCARRWK